MVSAILFHKLVFLALISFSLKQIVPSFDVLLTKSASLDLRIAEFFLLRLTESKYQHLEDKKTSLIAIFAEHHKDVKITMIYTHVLNRGVEA
jgi:hypothetical protein